MAVLNCLQAPLADLAFIVIDAHYLGDIKIGERKSHIVECGGWCHNLVACGMIHMNSNNHNARGSRSHRRWWVILLPAELTPEDWKSVSNDRGCGNHRDNHPTTNLASEFQQLKANKASEMCDMCEGLKLPDQ